MDLEVWRIYCLFKGEDLGSAMIVKRDSQVANAERNMGNAQVTIAEKNLGKKYTPPLKYFSHDFDIDIDTVLEKYPPWN